jgi:hypothetical protein
MLVDPDSIAQTPYTEDSKADPVVADLGLSDRGVVDEWNRMSNEEKCAYEKKLIRKLDLRLIPWPTGLYLLSFLDRTNIGNAKILGVYSELHRWACEKATDIR